MSNINYARRWLFEPCIAASITLGLFIFMSHLVSPKNSMPDARVENSPIEITRKKRDERSDVKNRVIPDKPEVEELPPPPTIPQSRPSVLSAAPAIDAPLPDFSQRPDASVRSNDRRATPLVRIPPQYPQSQITREQEGWVLVEFTITATGTTANAVVIDAQPPKVFDRTVLKAIKRWKYQPKIVNGQAVAQHNMREVFRFELKDN